jgi:DNA-directed RNA polymerase subunit RPC12/RpoP
MWCPNQECPDALESGSSAEFVEGMIACPFCGAGLVSRLPAWDPAAAEIRLAPVMPIADASWLPRVKETLDAAGVRFRLQDAGVQRLTEWGGAVTGFDPGTGGPVVMVEEVDLERATELLRALKEEAGLDPGGAPPELTPPAWQPSSCAQCGKALESGEGDEPLAYCYHCGASLSPDSTRR